MENSNRQQYIMQAFTYHIIGGSQIYNKAIEIKPDDYIAYNNRGYVKYSLEDFKGAIADYNKAIEVKPDYYIAYNNRGNAKYSLENFKGAMADYNKAIQLKPDDAIAYYKRGLVKKILEDFKSATADYNKAIQLNNYYATEDSKDNLKNYNFAEIVYISESGLHVAVPVLIHGYDYNVLAFSPRKNGNEKGDFIYIAKNLMVALITKKDGSKFYFFKPGDTNFVIALKEKPSHNDFDDYYDSYDESREDHYDEMGNSVCEYCGDYHCDCQRNIDSHYEDY